VDIANADILDFGCGALPVASASFALRYPQSRVCGTDIVNIDTTLLSRTLVEETGLAIPPNLEIYTTPPNSLPSHLGLFDLVYSWSVFEHIPSNNIEHCFSLIRERLKSSGVFFFQIGGLYFSHNGSHLSNYSNEPWHHLMYSISELQEKVFNSTYPQAKKEREWQQFKELNRLAAASFIAAAERAGLLTLWQKIEHVGNPPPSLLQVYSAEALTAYEIRALFKRGR
jgi:cyclopropane fatty-acyl-phospholipid synthase-like methyltransferase